jgi:NAD(P)-dependent dehydrogenase (short-subunit alcohol dehydrogenase family)
MNIVITGANRGIGLELTRRYIDRGDTVFATARKPEQAAELQALSAKATGRLRLIALDVTDGAACAALPSRVETPRVELLINNAGVSSGWGGLDELDFATALRDFDANALGPVRVVRALRGKLVAAHGKVVNMTSLMGSIADNQSGRGYGYRMSKVALNMATVNLALELAPEGVTCVCVHPGWVKTDMGGPGAPTPVGESAGQVIMLIDRLGNDSAGKFYHAEGRPLPW